MTLFLMGRHDKLNSPIYRDDPDRPAVEER